MGGDFTAVDISLFFAAYVLAENPRVKVLNQENYPRTYEWYQRMKERPAAKKAYE